jgi:iduronate 2-sulfatase
MTSVTGVASILLVLSIGFADRSSERKNVLFLVSDDMRPQLKCYSGTDFPSPVHPSMHSPSLDALASKSLLLKRAYVQQALCSPSRTSLLTGRRPDTTHVYDMNHYFREVGGNFTTIPQYFKENGYLSIGMGKVFHVSQSLMHELKLYSKLMDRYLGRFKSLRR